MKKYFENNINSPNVIKFKNSSNTEDSIKKSNETKEKKYYNMDNWNNMQRSGRRKFLLKLQDNKCKYCGINEWNGVKLILELHHIDGDRYNNDFENCIMLCPNCHAITSNYKGRNSKKYKNYKYSDNEIIEIAKNSYSINNTIENMKYAMSKSLYERISKIISENNIEFKKRV